MLARIHIATNMDLMDDDVYVELNLPYPLHVGNTIYLERETVVQLEKMATRNRDIAHKYYPEWFHCREGQNFDEADMKDIDFSEAVVIGAISYREGEPFVDIELCDFEEYESTEQKIENLVRELRRLQNKVALN